MNRTQGLRLYSPALVFAVYALLTALEVASVPIEAVLLLALAATFVVSVRASLALWRGGEQ